MVLNNSGDGGNRVPWLALAYCLSRSYVRSRAPDELPSCPPLLTRDSATICSTPHFTSSCCSAGRSMAFVLISQAAARRIASCDCVTLSPLRLTQANASLPSDVRIYTSTPSGAVELAVWARVEKTTLGNFSIIPFNLGLASVAFFQI